MLANNEQSSSALEKQFAYNIFTKMPNLANFRETYGLCLMRKSSFLSPAGKERQASPARTPANLQ